ncbi:unnamed protein product, partial [Nesidiocoris tenuis]
MSFGWTGAFELVWTSSCSSVARILLRYQFSRFFVQGADTERHDHSVNQPYSLE